MTHFRRNNLHFKGEFSVRSYFQHKEAKVIVQVKKLIGFRGQHDFPGLVDLEAVTHQIGVLNTAIDGAASDPASTELKVALEAQRADLESQKKAFEAAKGKHDADQKAKKTRFENFLANSCRLIGCERSPRPSPKSGSKRKERRYRQSFCADHCGFKKAISKDDVRKMASDPYLRVVLVDPAA